jgi:hypothetical protein
MGGEYVHLRRFHSDEVMVVVLIAECASKTHSNFKSTMDRNCYDWLKKYTVSKVVARDNGGCVRKKGSFDGHNLHFRGHNLGHNHKLLYLCPRL